MSALKEVVRSRFRCLCKVILHEGIGSIYNWVTFEGSLREKMKTLKRKCVTLSSKEGDINQQLQHAESSSRKKRKREVEDWLVNSARMGNEVQKIESEVSKGGLLERRRLMYRVEHLTKEAAELMERGEFPQGLTLDDHESAKEVLLTSDLVGRASKTNLESIWEHLRRPEVLIIGVWGMIGVGKTNLVAHIHNRIQQHSDTFSHVYWITLSENPTIYKLQYDIAKAIRINLSFEKDERKRAAILSRELGTRRRSVLILDNTSYDICLKTVGIPLLVNGCKLIITTRSLEVCRRLGCQLNINIEPFSEYEEAWELFLRNLKHHTPLSSEVLVVAKSVVRECAGHPFWILMVARYMSGMDNISDWRDTLNTLRDSSKSGLIEMGKKGFKLLECSYCRLNVKKEVLPSFLYCLSYPVNHKIEREALIRHLVVEGIIGRMSSMQEEFDRGHAILNTLVNSSLLEDARCNTDKDAVKMHVFVRSVAIKEMGSRFMVKAGVRLDEVPDEREWSEDVERVSLMDNAIKEIAPGTSPRCPNLLTLLLSGNRLLKRIDNSFFKYMPALQFLDLSFCNEIEELPPSISHLKNLTGLVFCGMTKLQRVPSLAKMKSLQHLDLAWSGVKEVPDGLEVLDKLTYLDLDAESLQVFPTGTLPKLYRLEYLKFCVKSDRIKIKGQEWRRLTKLSTFQGWLTFDDNVNGVQEFVCRGGNTWGPIAATD